MTVDEWSVRETFEGDKKLLICMTSSLHKIQTSTNFLRQKGLQFGVPSDTHQISENAYLDLTLRISQLCQQERNENVQLRLTNYLQSK